MIWQWLSVAAGGAIGATLRFAVSGYVLSLTTQRTGSTFPWGTLAVNVLGCLLIGILAPLLTERSILRPELRSAVIIGVLGAFTTWSSFGYETIRLFSDGQWRQAVLYVAGTNAGCLLAVWIAFRMTTRGLGAG